MTELLAGTKKKGESLIDELHAKKRVAIVDWKEHPIEVMAWLDQIGGKAWKKDAERLASTESLDLARCLPDKFLAACAGPFEHLGFSLLSFDRDSDEAIFTGVPTTAVDATLSSVKKRGVKIARV